MLLCVMPYRKLSEQIQNLAAPQRSDTFLKQFRNAVREGKFDAIPLPERFSLPKVFNRRGEEGTYQREAKDMLFDVTPAFEKWFDQTNQELSAQPARGTGKPKVTVENVEAGLVDFKVLAQDTRRKMQASFDKGQALGNSRKQKVKPKSTRGRAKK